MGRVSRKAVQAGLLALSIWLAVGAGAIAETNDLVTTSEKDGWIRTHIDHTKPHPDPLHRQMEAGDRLAFQGELRQAIAQYRILLDQARQPNQQIWKVVALTRMAQAQTRLSQYPTALETLKAAQAAHQAVNQNIDQQALDSIDVMLSQHSHLRDILETRGSIYAQLGQLEQAIANYQECFHLSRRDPLSYRRDVFVLNQIGNLYAQMGQRDQARTYYHQALVFIDTVGTPFTADRKPTASLPIPQLHRTLYGPEWRQLLGPRPWLDRLEQDPTYIRRFLTSRLLHPWSRPALVLTLNNLGRFYSQNGRDRVGVELHHLALQEAEKLGDRHLMGLSLLNLGELQRRKKAVPKAIQHYQQAVQLAEQVGDRSLQGDALEGLGQAYSQAGQLPQATQTLTSAAQVLESLRPGLSDRHLISLFNQQADIYRRLQQLLVQQNQIGPALEVSERGRARAFVELLSRRQNSDATGAANLPNQAQLQQIAKQQQTTLVSYSIIPPVDATGSAQLYSWVVKPTGEIGFRQVDLRATLPGSGLSDLVDQVRSQSMGVQGRGVRGRQTRDWKPVSDQVSFATTRQKDPHLQQLHRVLIEPIAELLPTDPGAKVTFVPQDKLFLVPFAALQDAQGKFLIEQHTIAIAPSIQVLDLLQTKSAAPVTRRPLIVGNPTMPKLRLEDQGQLEALSPLPGAEVEATQIAQMLKTQPLVGNAATKLVVMQQMAQADIIHLATHGLMDDFNGKGMPGAIALAPSSNDGGLLTSDEIMDLKLQADLVVLSACDTGRGRITGDGVIGLSRSLLSAGAKSVVVSLWAVPDGPTADLMTTFYEQFAANAQSGASGASKPGDSKPGAAQRGDRAVAMRQAMLHTLQEYPNPRDWAAFMVIGN
jgi:CHAT domain-containing protein